jgi:apolipoprotein N-acyltransferase
MNRIQEQVLRAPAAVSLGTDPRPIESAQPSDAVRKPRILVPVLLTAALLWASYFPLNLGWLGWVAMIPFLVLVRLPGPPRLLYGGSFLAGLLFFVASLQWMRVADYRMYATWIGLSLACAAFFPIGLLLLRRLDSRTRLPLIVTFPGVWTGLEYVRAHLFTGFPWYFLSHSQHDFLPIIQISDLTGAYGVSFLVAAVNALAFEILYSWTSFRGFFGLPEPAQQRRLSMTFQALVLVLTVAGAFAYGLWRLSEDSFSAGPRIGLIQGNLPQSVRNEATASVEKAIESVKEHYAGLTDQAVAQKVKPTLLVWPETSYPYDWVEISPNMPPYMIPADWAREVKICHILARDRAQRWHADLLLGLNSSVLAPSGKEIRYNSAVLTKSDGSLAGRYNKIHCVPFGEYVPLKDWVPWMNKLAPYDFDYSVHAGEDFTRFSTGEYRFGVLICYEDTDPYLARQYLRSDTGGSPVDFIVNISNDGWFHGTSEHEQHLAICRFRAVECRRPIARAVNMGISAIIDGNGRIVALPGPTWREAKNIGTFLNGEIPLDHRTSLYAAWGDWLPWSCWLFVLAAILWSGFR